MKKILLLASIGITSISEFNAQSIPNPSFENWSTTNYEQPNPWNTANTENLRRGGPINVTKVAGVSGFGVRMETAIINPDTFNAYIINSNGDPMAGDGGVPYSQLPTAITGSYRYNLGVNDTAIILVFFKKNGAVISNDIIKIKGTGNQPTFAAFSFPLTVSVIPDSVIVAAASSNAITNEGVTNGSFLELDNLGFSGPGVTQALAGGNFDNWTLYTQNVLMDWRTQGEGVSKVSPGHSGSFAVQMVTMDYGPGEGIHASSVSIGEQSQSGPIGGMPFTNQFDTLCGYYKYFTPSNDSAAVMYNVMSNGMNIGGMYESFGPASNWTYFELPIFSFTPPDTLNINMHSSANYPVDNSTAGSTFIVDDVHLKSQLVGIKSLNPFDMVFSTYPNPATELVNISWNKTINENFNIKVYSITGQLISSESVKSGSSGYQLNVKDYADGTYLVNIESSTKIWRTAFIKK
ncbi:MAG: T9SS type A sorting domain-containing protein [Bacteroidota bacterium]|nr:T9SS type A sorting domain-containing protein [Bacteroidota bacterium]